jgi:hypothetical protein
MAYKFIVLLKEKNYNEILKNGYCGGSKDGEFINRSILNAR